ncbi:proliferation-associated protein 2G4 [Folsomia candida]|uniref:Proliferation-associated protein 2G4 n=1 Tax=Folsomia candida TaxID=158441 RepID=A0A226EG53_FOLCA|nr:proliferation-associated protein 2G4 [Folsomia candida]OXA56643.1 Proliferation-associated protein 2G4 [Folsomia candida]
MGDKEDSEKTIAEDLVVTKYKMAAEITQKALKTVVEKAVIGASVRDLCIIGDKIIVEETGKQFKKEKDMKKGIAFPTCISVNNCICHFSPLSTEPDYILKEEDVCKIDMGAHIAGFIAVVAHTIVVAPQGKVTGRKADVMLAAHYCSEAALRLVRPANESDKVTAAVQTISESFKCKPIEGMLSHQLHQNRIDGEKTIIQNPNDAQKKEYEKCTFEVNEVYAVDVLISTGEGQGKEMTTRVAVYKRTEEQYMLKLKAARAFFSEVQSKHGTMAFNLRDFEDEKKAKLGVLECVKTKLIDPYQVLYEKPNEIVAQFKFTVLLMPSGLHKITGLPVDPDLFQSEYKIEDEEIKKLLATGVNPAKKNKKKAAKAAAGGDAAAAVKVDPAPNGESKA